MTARRGRRTAFDPGTVGRWKRGSGTRPPQRWDGRASTVCSLTVRPSVASLEQATRLASRQKEENESRGTPIPVIAGKRPPPRR
eukprot:2259637-Pyramimonas_sp.AAC.1